jgi:hypothetical protein
VRRGAERWSIEEDWQLLDEFLDKTTQLRMAELHNRSRNSIRARLTHLGCIGEPCKVEWLDDQGVRHGCARWSADHKRAHECGCGQRRPR